MNTSNHIIRRATFDLIVRDQKGSYELQETVSRLFADYLESEIEAVLSKFDIAGQRISIDKLFVDVGQLNPDQIESSVKIFQRALDHQMVLYFNRNQIQTKTDAELDLLHLGQFLNEGILPWNCSYSAPALLERVLSSWSNQTRHVLMKILQLQSARFRFIHQFSDQSKILFLNRLSGDKDWSDVHIQDLSRLLNPSLWNDILSKPEAIMGKRAQEVIEHLKGSRLKESSLRLPENDKNNRQSSGSTQDHDYIVVNNAGVVLLNPFIEKLFEYNHIIHNRTFVSTAHQIRGIFLLNYLVTGLEEIEESESALLKLLCGMDWSEPIPRTLELTDDEKTFCMDLLQSAIVHWKALKNTSPDGLRSMFLQREGHISGSATGYLLKIQQTGPDILFSYQPPDWTMSIIKLPWMLQKLSVDWV